VRALKWYITGGGPRADNNDDTWKPWRTFEYRHIIHSVRHNTAVTYVILLGDGIFTRPRSTLVCKYTGKWRRCLLLVHIVPATSSSTFGWGRRPSTRFIAVAAATCAPRGTRRHSARVKEGAWSLSSSVLPQRLWIFLYIETNFMPLCSRYFSKRGLYFWKHAMNASVQYVIVFFEKKSIWLQY
jgi:hypothetical protein